MKTSLKKTKSNRRNAQLSTGPTSPEGKAASSRNALRHGLTTATLTVLPTEDPRDLEKLRATLTGEWTPQGDAETFLVDQMISARWKLARLQRMEAEALDEMLEGRACLDEEDELEHQSVSADRHLVHQLGYRNNIFEKLERYTRSTERAYSKAVKELQQLRAARAKTEKQNEATRKRGEAEEAERWLRDQIAQTPIQPIDPWILYGDDAPGPLTGHAELDRRPEAS